MEEDELVSQEIAATEKAIAESAEALEAVE
jgi:hypothetical protein